MPTSPPTGRVRRRRRSIAANTAMNGVAQFASLFSTLVFFPLLVQRLRNRRLRRVRHLASVTGFALHVRLRASVSPPCGLVAQAGLRSTTQPGFAVVVVDATALLMTLLGIAVALAMIAHRLPPAARSST